VNKCNVKVEMKTDGCGGSSFWWRVVHEIDAKQYRDKQYVKVTKCDWISRETKQALFDENTVLEICASKFGGWRHAEVRKFFIVRPGETAQVNDQDGTRKVELAVENCRAMTKDEVFQHFGFRKNDLGFYTK